MSFVTIVGEFAVAGGAGVIGMYAGGALGAAYAKHQGMELEGLVPMFLGGVAGGVGAAVGTYMYLAADADVDAALPTVNQIIELQLEDGQTCPNNRYIIGDEGQVIGCAFD